MKNPFAGLNINFQEQASSDDFLTKQDIMAGASQSAWFKCSDAVDQARFRDLLNTSLDGFKSELIAPGLYKNALNKAVAYVLRNNNQDVDAADIIAKSLIRDIKKTIREKTEAERAELVRLFLALPDYTDSQLHAHQRALDLIAGH